MDIEEIIKGIIAILIVGVSIALRLSRNKRSQNAQTTNDTPTSQNSPKKDIFAELIQSIESSIEELDSEGESQEEIIDEIAESRERVALVENKPKQQKQKKDRITKNATNRTLKKNRKSNKSCDKNSHSSRKFNLRDAVIYSEILTPKFKQTDME